MQGAGVRVRVILGRGCRAVSGADGNDAGAGGRSERLQPLSGRGLGTQCWGPDSGFARRVEFPPWNREQGSCECRNIAVDPHDGTGTRAFHT